MRAHAQHKGATWSCRRVIRCCHRAMAKMLAVSLAVVLAMAPLPAQSGGDQGAAPTRLKIVALTETPMTEYAGTLSANVLQIRITDQWDMPVRGVTVSFRLPEAGPGGVFLNGLSSEIALTDERGEAAVRGFDWRPEAGVTFVHVIAAFGAVRAGAMVEVQLAHKLKEFPATVASPVNPTAAAIAAAEMPAAPLQKRPDSVPVVEEVPQMAAVGAQPTPRPALGQPAETPTEDARRAALLPPVSRAPRDLAAEPADATAMPPMVRVRGNPVGGAASEAGDPASNALVRVKQGGGGGISKALILVLVAGAAAGGAVAVGMSRGGGASASPSGGASLPPVIRIGNPTITITGGN